jgi:hypothetical protein
MMAGNQDFACPTPGRRLSSAHADAPEVSDLEEEHGVLQLHLRALSPEGELL